MTTQLQTAPQTMFAQGQIEGIDQPVIGAYFDALNDENYDALVELFSEAGVLQPPFDDPLIGRQAIAHYLKAEALGMRAYPAKGALLETTEAGDRTYQIRGRVQLPLFSVNVAWQFRLNPEDEILAVTVDLLATLEELIQYRR
ncbi:nuclear transport factor 2 family protein [Candidatus Synechococcus calcipolaris G9]|uniref:Nuclear transport factor 2 family protein n=1 Tax=Candidatus Synechococcus calcipolaris G9 TaxID=1497997 RepID=A0ABT6F1P2_9SYNE|nr:nuclear transport factor 2 family protein [Candidatus Synechococcus calcipolaris]MDG2991780.1 nuclear transport factor 2 family protein [Candidatus Synechococcus calcipolaris G9]